MAGRGHDTYGFALNLVSAAFYVAVTVLFFYLFKPVNTTISLLAAIISLLGCAITVLNLFHLASRISPLLFFGPYCLLLGYLIFRSTFLPRVLGAPMMLAGLGWLTFLVLSPTSRAIPYFLHEQHARAGIFFTELAFASIIVSTFGLTIDRYQREEFVKLVNDERGELKRDIFLYAYGHTVPDQIREEIKEQILNCPFQRSDRRIELEFSHIDGTGDRVLVQKRITFVVKNVTALDQTFKFEYSQITASEREMKAAHEFQCLKIRRGAKPEEILGPNDLLDRHPDEDTHVRKVTKDFVIGPTETAEIYYAMKENRRAYQDDVFGSKHPVVGSTLLMARVNPPLTLDMSAACKGKVPRTRPEHNPPRLYAWHFDEGLLPYQGISISWSPRPEIAPARSSPEVAAVSDLLPPSAL